MIKINAATLQQDKPKLFETALKVMELNRPILQDHIRTIHKNESGLLDHSLFCRIEDDEKKKHFLEIQTLVFYNPVAITFQIHDVIIYDDLHTYIAARARLIEESKRKHGYAFDERKKFEL